MPVIFWGGGSWSGGISSFVSITGLEVFIGPICAIAGDIRVKENTDRRRAHLQENRRKAELENMMRLHNEALDMTSSARRSGKLYCCEARRVSQE